MPAANTRPTSVLIGFVLFGIGLLFLLGTVLPYFFGGANRPLWLNLGCLLVPVGLAIAVAGALRSGRAEQRDAIRRVKAQAGIPRVKAQAGIPRAETAPEGYGAEAAHEGLGAEAAHEGLSER